MSKINLNDFSGLQNVLRVVAKENGLTVKYQQQNELVDRGWDMDDVLSPEQDRMSHLGIPFTTDDKVIHVPMIDPSWSKDKQEDIIAVSIHEANHHSPQCRDDFDLILKEELDMQGSLYGRMFNLLSDYKNEHSNYGKYAGADKLQTSLIAKMISAMAHDIDNTQIQTKLDEAGVSEEEREKIQKSIDVYSTFRGFDILARSEWNHKMRGNITQLDTISERSKGWLNKIVEDGLIEQQNQCTTAEETQELLDKLLSYVELDPEEEKKKSQEQQQAKSGEGRGRNKEGEPNKAEGKGKEGDGEKVEKFVEEYWKNLNHDAHTHERGETAGMKIIYEDDDLHGASSFIPHPDPHILEKEELHAYNNVNHGWVQDTLNTWKSSHNLANTVRNLLQVRSQAHWRGQQPRGKLSSRDLYRLASHDTSIFRRKEIALTKDVSVTVLIDWSGSMGSRPNNKFACAAVAANELNNAICVNNIPLEILAFSYSDYHSGGVDKPVHVVLKKFKERVFGNRIVEECSRYTDSLANNSDGEALLWAISRLQKQPTKRKVLIVLSDGQPASGNASGDDARFLKEVVKSIEASPIEVYGVGVLSDSVKHFYKDHTVIKNTDELANGPLTIVKNKIIR